MELDGIESAPIGICTSAIITIIAGMDAHSGDGDDSDVLGCICTASVPCTETIKAIGDASARTGICTGAITTTRDPVGFGDVIVVLAVICTVCESFSDLMGQDGTRCAVTGICTVATITITIFTDVTVGHGAAIDALVFTCTGCAPCTVTIKVTGAVCDRTGTFGGGTITTNDLAGSGPILTDVLAGISTGCVCTKDSTVLDGTSSGGIGICTVEMSTITICTDATDGHGVVIGGLAHICTVIAFTGEIIKATGVASEAIGTCGDEIIITSDLAGSGVDLVKLVAIYIDCAFCVDGLALAGCVCAATGTCTGETTIIIVCTDAIAGCGDDSEESESTCIASELCSGTIRVIGAVSGRTGTCGDATIITEGTMAMGNL
jgi:hypothetical protein